ncbi:hypothetical protein ACGFY7_07180 [Streptomyces prunicolor]|uniref:hypothetical protein n=1 Tax=Streptomyces prunicolor TaxID=67348 RepID=UPI003718E85D
MDTSAEDPVDLTMTAEVYGVLREHAWIGQVDVLLAVWDGRPARGYGGTADVVTYAREHDVPVRVLRPEGATRD